MKDNAIVSQRLIPGMYLELEPGDCTKYRFVVTMAQGVIVVVNVEGAGSTIVFAMVTIRQYLTDNKEYDRERVNHPMMSLFEDINPWTVLAATEAARIFLNDLGVN